MTVFRETPIRVERRGRRWVVVVGEGRELGPFDYAAAFEAAKKYREGLAKTRRAKEWAEKRRRP